MSSLKPVRGTHDLFGEEIKKHLHIVDVARKISQRFGCEEISTPIFEFTPVFSRTLGEASDIVNKEMYTFPDKGNELLTLRPEGTAGIARAFISNGMSQNVPLKFFYNGPMFRYERPQKGRQRQFHQLGIEYIGTPQNLADVELISLAYILLESLKISDFILHINSIGDKDSRSQFRQALIEYLTPYQSELSQDSQKRLTSNPLRILDSKDPKDQKIIEDAPKLVDFLNSKSQSIKDNVLNGLSRLGIPFHINSQLVRGLDYYSHCVFEFKSSQLGAQDTLLAGGRYDGLIPLMGGPEAPAVGFAAGIERLALVIPEIKSHSRPIFVIAMGESAEAPCLKLSYELRKAGYLIEMPFSGNASKRMKKASKANAQLALLMGEDEIRNNQITVKDLDNGQQDLVALNEIFNWIKKLSF